jgi:hypothetical protein
MKRDRMFGEQERCRSIEDIEMKLDNLRLMGLKVVKVNICNVISSENTSLVDILQQNPQIVSLGIGLGVPSSSIESTRLHDNGKPSKLYNVEQITSVTLQYNPSSPVEIILPKNTREFILNLSLGKPTGSDVGQYLSRVVTGRCSPSLTLLGIENVETWEGFNLPDRVISIKTDKRRNLPTAFITSLRTAGFERASRGDEGVVFLRKEPPLK